MKAKPEYIIIGNGKLAKHLCHYFSLMKIRYARWKKGKDLCLLEKHLQDTDIVLLAISDDSIKPFIKSNKELLKGKTIIHFSGALVTKKAYGCHPLMTFSGDLYDLEFYKTILFSIDEDTPEFKTLFPKLPNPYIVIPSELKPFYHSLCVLANNCTSLLWSKFYDEMESVFGAKPEHLD